MSSDDRSWLGLLIAESTVEELEAHRAALIAAGRDRARTETEARQAVQLHALLADRRRRATELTALDELARQLAALRRPADVLGQIAGQARRLLGVDLGYVMLADAEGVLRMEVVDGSIGDALRGARIRPGTGIGGLVMESGHPRWTGDYLRDASVHRPGDLHDAAAREGLTAVLGVPLHVGGSTIGVLFAADRRPRTFADHEVGLLTALAAHGAIAIHNANLFEQLQRTAAELERRDRLLRRAVEMHERLTGIVLGGGSLDDVVGVLAGVLDAEVTVLGPDNAVLAGAGRARDGRPGELSAADFHRDGIWHTRQDRQGTGFRAASPIVLGDSYAGCLVARRSDPPDEEAVRSLEAGATVVGLVLALRRAAREGERRMHGELIAALLGGHLDETALRERAGRAGVDLGRVRTVAVLDADGDTGLLAGCADAIVGAAGGWSAEHEGSRVLLLTGADVDRVTGLLRTHRPSGARVTAAVAQADGSPAGTVAGIHEAYRAARGSVGLLLALGRAGSVAVADELAAYRVVFSASGRDELRRFVESNIGRLVEHDRRRATDLVPTLEAYLEHGGAHTAAAAALHVHPNTLYQRLSRITEVLGEQWRDPGRRLDLQLALRLRRLVESLEAR